MAVDLPANNLGASIEMLNSWFGMKIFPVPFTDASLYDDVE
jgi:hypothetical protein